MDLLHKRYASPFSFMDGMILTGRFEEFVVKLVNTVNEEKEEKNTWEFFLHKIIDKSYKEFRAELETNKSNLNMSEETIEATVQESNNILKNFNPQKEGGEK